MCPAPFESARECERSGREVRLKAAHAHDYPGLEPGVWYPAGMVADYIQYWLLRHPNLIADGRPRRLDGEHFEFRGGQPRATPWVPGVSPDTRAPVERSRVES